MGQINIISNYLNRVNMKININEINSRNNIKNIGKYKSLFSDCKYYPYPLLYYLGNYMNINIISFSNYSYTNLNNIDNNKLVNIHKYQNNKPSSKKIAKFIKLLMINFPDKKYTFEFLLLYVLANLTYADFNQKYLEIVEIIKSFNLNLNLNNCFQNINNTNIKCITQKFNDTINMEIKENKDNSVNESKNKKSINNITNINSNNKYSSFLSDNNKNENGKEKNKMKSHQKINTTLILSNSDELNNLYKTNKNKNHKNKESKKRKELTFNDESNELINK
jgi:hypothetical protein